MVLIEGGEFLRGEAGHTLLKNCRPAHPVTVSSFYISRLQVTEEEWKDIHPPNPSPRRNRGLPVAQVSWWDAIAYCIKLSQECGFAPCYRLHGGRVEIDIHAPGYRLPTEAEWEYAARGGRLTRGYTYSGSNDLDEVGWYKNNSGGRPHRVGAKKPNELGIHDMSGNLWEWCWDWYAPYAPGPRRDPTGPAEGTTRVYRGGSWVDFTYACAVASRGSRDPGRGYHDIGFRLARSPA
jgi:sulfatase modifying factor 1